MLCRPGGVASATCAAQDKDSDKPFDLGAALKRKQSTAATRRGDVVSLPASDRFESLEERHGKILEAGMQPFAGSWKEKLHAELFEPAFLNLVLATAEQKREKLLGSQQAGTAANIQDAAPPGHLPLQQATAVFDEILALYGVAIANRVAESHVPVPPVPTSVLKRWRQQYGVSADAPVSHAELVFWVQYTLIKALEPAYLAYGEHSANPLAMLHKRYTTGNNSLELLGGGLLAAMFLLRLKGMAGKGP